MKTNKKQVKKQKIDKGQVFVKVIMGMLAFMMLFSSVITLIYAFI